MNISKQTYELIRKIHLYASLTTLVFFAMYLITSFMMMHHDFFHPGEAEKFTEEFEVSANDISDENWDLFLSEHGVHGKQVRERTSEEGDLIRDYDSPQSHYKLTIAANRQSVSIETMNRNTAGAVIGFHRLRGYEGPITYLLYAFMLDVTAIALIVFALTGIILWLNVLKDKRWGWATLAFGMVYVGAVMGYLMMV